MGWETWRRLNQSMSRRFWGEPIGYQPVNGVEVERRGVFSDAHVFDDMQDDLTASTIAPALRVMLADWPAHRPPAQDDLVTLKRTGERFRVSHVKSDGRQAADLKLTRL